SIFQVIRNKKKNAEFVEYDFESPKILIMLPPPEFVRYDLYRARIPYSELLVTTLILPGLTLALEYITASPVTDDEADDGVPRWRRSLERRLEQLGILELDSTDTFVVAQKILENPVVRAFSAIDDRESREE